MEELNQVQETYSSEENLFADDEETTEEESLFDEEEEEVDSTPKEEVEEKKDEPFLSIKYNKEDKGLSKDEAISLAQKGMNYDKVNERYGSLNSRLERLAKANNQDVEAYLNALDEMQSNLLLEKEIEALRNQYEDVDEALLKEIAQSRVNAREKEAISNQKKEETSHNEAIAKQVDEFQELFPNVDATKLEAQVYQLMDKGKSLTEAYLIVEHNKQVEMAKAKEKVDSQNEANKKKSLGNIGNVANSESDDDFMKGFNKF